MEEHLAVCEKCFVKERLSKTNFMGNYSLPIGWTTTDIGDLCPDCYKKYKELLKGYTGRKI